MAETVLKWQCPVDRSYHPEHLWVKREGTQVVVGVTDYLQDTAGSILFVQLPPPGSKFAAGDPLFSLEAAKWVGHFPAPVAGRVAAVNEALQTRPGLVNADCYGDGWLVRMAVVDGAEAPLLTAEDYLRHLEELAREEGHQA